MTHQCALVAATVMASTTAVLAEPAQQPYASLLIGGGFLSEATPSGGVLDDDFATASDGPFRVGRSAGLSFGYR